MGCCQSTERSYEEEAGGGPGSYIRSHGRGDSSSRHIAAAHASGPPRGSYGDSHGGGDGGGDGDGDGDGDSTRARAPARRQASLGDPYNQPLRPHEWTAKKRWTRPQLDRERNEYFDTRVSGRAESWSAIRMAIDTMETDLGTAQTILDAAGITVPTGDLVNGVYDEPGNFYQIPEHCVSDPTNMIPSTSEAAPSLKDGTAPPLPDTDDEDDAQRRREEKGKGVVHAAEIYHVRARLSDRGGPDVQIAMSREQTIRVLARRVQEEAAIQGRNKVKIAYMGKILKESQTLPAQGWQEGHVVNALVFP